jgi:hypothetical protein
MMMKFRSFCLSLQVLILGCASAPGPGAPARDWNGDRFLCGARGTRPVCLSIVRTGCAVQFVAGESIPAETAEKIVVRLSFGEEDTVRGPADLAGCVRIASAAEALEYLRFFSSASTVHLFEPQQLEVFQGPPHSPACRSACLPPRVWQKLGLAEPRVTSLNGGAFEVTRIVIKPEPQPSQPTLYRVTERVARDGAVEILSEQAIPSMIEDLAGLSFPAYL